MVQSMRCCLSRWRSCTSYVLSLYVLRTCPEQDTLSATNWLLANHHMQREKRKAKKKTQRVQELQASEAFRQAHVPRIWQPPCPDQLVPDASKAQLCSGLVLSLGA